MLDVTLSAFFFFIKFFNQYLGSMKLLISSSHSVSDLVWRHTG